MASIVQRLSGNPNIHYFYCSSATPAFKKGDLVKLHTDGGLVIGTAGVILGIAMKNAPASTSSLVPVDVVTPEGTFLVKSHVTTAQAHIADTYDFDFTTTAVVLTTNSAADVTILDTWAADLGVSGGHLVVKFNLGSCQSIDG